MTEQTVCPTFLAFESKHEDHVAFWFVESVQITTPGFWKTFAWIIHMLLDIFWPHTQDF